MILMQWGSYNHVGNENQGFTLPSVANSEITEHASPSLDVQAGPYQPLPASVHHLGFNDNWTQVPELGLLLSKSSAKLMLCHCLF